MLTETIIGSYNWFFLHPRQQIIIPTNANILLAWELGKDLNEMYQKLQYW